VETALKLGLDSREGKIGADEFVKAVREVINESEKAVKKTSELERAVKLLASTWLAWKLYDHIREVSLLNARYETLGIVLEVVGRNAGYTASEVERVSKAVENQGITMNEARQSVTRMIQAQLDINQASKLARTAQDAAVIGAINSSEAFQRMVTGIQEGNVLILRNIGINVNFEAAYQKTAVALGLNVAQLTESQKAQARMNTVLEAGHRIAGTYEAAMGTAGKQILSMQRYSENLKTTLGEVFNEALTIGVMAWSEQLQKANRNLSDMSRNGELKAWGEELVDIFAALADSIDAILNATRQAGAFLAREARRSEIRDWYDTESKRQVPGGAANFSDLAKLQELRKQEQQMLQDADLEYANSTDAVWQRQGRFGRAVTERRAAQAADAAERATQRREDDRDAAVADALGYRRGPKAEGKVDTAAEIKRREEFMDRLNEMVLEKQLEAAGTSKFGTEQAKVLFQAKRAGVSPDAIQGQLGDIRNAEKAVQERKNFIDMLTYQREVEDEVAVATGRVEDAEKQAAITFRKSHMEEIDAAEFSRQNRFKTADEQKYLTDLRRVDIEVQHLSEGATIDQIARLKEYAKTIKERITDAYDASKTASESFVEGARKGFASWSEYVSNASAQSASAVGRVFKSAEDVLTEFVKSGKLNFRSLVDVIIDELTRIAVVRPILKTVSDALDGILKKNAAAGGGTGLLQGLFGSSSSPSAVPADTYAYGASPEFATGGIMTPWGRAQLRRYAGGGIARSPTISLFGEGSRPEAYVPLPDGKSIPVKMDGGGKGDVTVLVNVTISQNGDIAVDTKAPERLSNLGNMVGDLVAAAIVKEKRSGGLLDGTK
jgi:lambda family phage tail tape measure protein